MDSSSASKFLHEIGFTPDRKNCRHFIITMSEIGVSEEEIQIAHDFEHLKAIVLSKLNDVTINMARSFIRARSQLESGIPLTRTWGLID